MARRHHSSSWSSYNVGDMLSVLAIASITCIIAAFILYEGSVAYREFSRVYSEYKERKSFMRDPPHLQGMHDHLRRYHFMHGVYRETREQIDQGVVSKWWTQFIEQNMLFKLVYRIVSLSDYVVIGVMGSLTVVAMYFVLQYASRRTWIREQFNLKERIAYLKTQLFHDDDHDHDDHNTSTATAAATKNPKRHRRRRRRQQRRTLLREQQQPNYDCDDLYADAAAMMPNEKLDINNNNYIDRKLEFYS